MFWGTSRDLIVETATILRRVEKNMHIHTTDNEKKFEAINELIKDCHETCPEKDRFDEYAEAQTGTLLRMEKKYDTFFREHSEEFGLVKNKVSDMYNAKKTRREMLCSWLAYITIIGIIIGSLFGYLKYESTQKNVSTQQIENMLEKIINKG